jgi:hypothetical protein
LEIIIDLPVLMNYQLDIIPAGIKSDETQVSLQASIRTAWFLPTVLFIGKIRQ